MEKKINIFFNESAETVTKINNSIKSWLKYL